MAKTDDLTRVRHMLEHARKARQLVEGLNRSDFDQDEVLRLALVRLLEVIGEAATHVSPKIRAKHPQVAWPEIAGMRNRLIHGYDVIDLDVLWQTLEKDLQPLILELEKILALDAPDR